MPLTESLARLRLFRQSFEDGQIDEETGLSTADIDTILDAMKDPIAVYRMRDGNGEALGQP
jgi:hypothetical protein